MAKTETPKREITIQGTAFTVSQPYAEGHALTESEARALNQVRAENIRNNLASRVKNALNEEHEMTMEEVVAYATEYDASYDFSVASGGGARAALDPVEKMARKVAREALTAAIKADGKKVSDFDREELNAQIAELATTNEQIIEEAKKRVEAAKSLSTVEISL